MTEELDEQGNIEASVSYFHTFRLPFSSRILDVGTRFGSFLNKLHQAGYLDLTGVDIDANAIDRGRSIYRALAAQLRHYRGTSLPFESSQFDAVTAFDVIEHVPDVDLLLREIRRVLRPNGIFIFQTPNLLTNIPKEIIYTRSCVGWRQYHCSLQTLGSLRRLLHRAGFAGVEIVKRGILTEFNLAESRKHLGEFGPRLLRALQALPLPLYPNFWGNARNS